MPRHTIPTCSTCPNASMCTSYDTIPWMHRKVSLAKRELPGQVIQSQAWRSETIARAMVSNCNVGATTYGTHRTLPVLSCCDLPASTDQRARTYVRSYYVQIPYAKYASPAMTSSEAAPGASPGQVKTYKDFWPIVGAGS